MAIKRITLLAIICSFSLGGCITFSNDSITPYDPVYGEPDYDKSVDTSDVRRCIKGKGRDAKYPNCTFRKRDTKDEEQRNPFDPRNIPQQ